ncbi:MAG: Nucleoside-diphosphate-sugar epimerase [archaeon GW2011_AR20]|nr:MAG: Nucleoside-diphosphate-sugar epimerase [archaeon GW2011_AR20]MBS3160483.1 NAD-dependent epimerase/dehydratase family protein [Candidatus Woesearchaeota archaeon]
MKILIIGGSRFVGPLVVEKLLKKGHDVTIFNRGKIQSNYNKVKFVQGDRRNGFNIKDKFDAVIDTCAYKGEHTQRAINDLKFDYYLNFSTAAVYKKTTKFPLTEESEIGDWSYWGDYNKGKVECENVLKESKVNHANLRPVYILGKNNYVDRERFIYSRIENNRSLILPGNGEAKIQFVFAEDVADSIVLLSENKIEGNFNCCNDDIVTLKELTEFMGDVVGIKPLIEYNSNTDGENHDESEFPFANETFYCANDKLKKLGIKFIPLFEGLKEGYENYYKKIIF